MGRIIIGTEYFTGAQDLDGRLLALHNVYLTCRGLGSKQKFRRQVEGILHVSCGVILRGIQCGEVEKMKKAEYMEQFIGETFDGVISGVTSWGMYVELPNTIEGMVRVADIPGDYYYFEEERYQMVGEKTGKIYKLGQKVRVTVSAVDKLLRTIDFELNEEDENEHGEETDRK